jgi:hypothetical protein
MLSAHSVQTGASYVFLEMDRRLRLAPLKSASRIFESPGLAGAFLFWGKRIAVGLG